MSKSRLPLIVTIFGLSTLCSISKAEDKEIIFREDFDRANSEELGGEWDSKGDPEVKDKAAFFRLFEAEFRPRMKHAFPAQTEGKFTVSFVFDFLRESEGTWGFYLQLGNSEEIPKKLVYEADLAKGIGVNLIWGGGEFVNFQKAGTLGYKSGEHFKPLFVFNDKKTKETVVERAVFTIDVDVDAGTFTLKVGDKEFPDLPFDNKGPVDTIRFIANGCSESGFSRSSIDEIVVSKEK